MDGSQKVLYAGLIGNVLVAATKFVAAAVTQSAAMLSEAVHSLVDTSNELLLLYGARRAKRPPDDSHPLGHGREVYFWSFVVALVIFAAGAGFSLYQGVQHVLDPHPIESVLWSYAVLGASFVFEGGSWWVALHEFRRRKGARGYLQAAQETKDPSTVIVFLEDSAALVGLAIALAGTAGTQYFDMPVLDGAASIAIGLLLAAVAAFLARENKQLLIGESARKELVKSIQAMAEEEQGVANFNGMLTFQLAPREVVVALSLDFARELRAPEVQATVDRLESRIREKHPEIILLLIKPQEPDTYKRRHAARWQR
ncbi:MAG TPA: cation diffusion facilitator family transporter [Usitatibacter sp.]|nr:cation diffusion facilitator family transporter [Usitatibacter sp.]